MGDFGLTGKSGGTSTFMAPEGLSKESRIVVKTDLYSFAITLLFLMFPAELAIQLLYLPIAKNWEKFNESLSEFSLLLCIFDTLLSDPEERVDFDSWKVVLRNTKNFHKNWLTNRIDREILEENRVDLSPLNDSLEKEGGLYFYILDHFGKDIRSSRVNDNEAYKISTAISLIQNIPLLESKVELGLISKGYFQKINLHVCFFVFSNSRPRI